MLNTTKTLIVALLATLLFSSAAVAHEAKIPMVTFHGKTVSEVQSLIIGHCAETGNSIGNQTNNIVVCEKELTGSQAVLSQLLIGNAYSTKPVRTVQFVMIVSNDDVRVTWNATIHTQMALGQVQSVPFHNPKFDDYVRSLFVADGAE